ncbi:MAG: hypothetical protein AAF438_23795, partial [Pseudomonadota bacterium]
IGSAILPFTAKTDLRGLTCLPVEAGGNKLTAEIAAIWSPDMFLSEQLRTLIDLVADLIALAPFLAATGGAEKGSLSED